ncbi:ROK family transcriptional regulator [Microbacterium sp. KUDC0406]|uniref:ROK family transcriptional regulator n=1 Tax=Microbacterium sp. KUDC0406 TaxID=2909588 RepID=UPI001F1AA7A5|nr:winged helix-turn-helix transcriptional regulator [Microbacterium sp. KUDC0406]UJP09447.1 ROK family transcriptional regulator [Microbacterium sp. KUDC0406]
MVTATHIPVQGARRHNRGVVLQALLRESSASRADLARLTGLARPTITEVVRDLLADGVVIETGQSQEARVGKPSVLLEVDGDAVQTIAVDLTSPDWVVGAVCAPDGRILVRQEIARDTAPDLPAAVAELVARLTSQAGCPVLGVGFGVPMDAASGDAAAFVSALSALPETALLPALAAAEADLAARAEAGYGDAEFLLVRLGEVVSTAIVSGYTAGADTARELAHLDVGGDPGRQCRCGNTGCVHAWLAVLEERMDAAGDEQTREALRIEAGEKLGAPLAAIVSALDLPQVVLSGTSSLMGRELCSAAESALTAARLRNAHVEVRCGTTEDTVLRGAAAQVLAAELA